MSAPGWASGEEGLCLAGVGMAVGVRVGIVVVDCVGVGGGGGCQQAATIREQAHTYLRARKAIEQTISPTHQAEHPLGIGHAPRPGGPELGL